LAELEIQTTIDRQAPSAPAAKAMTSKAYVLNTKSKKLDCEQNNHHRAKMEQVKSWSSIISTQHHTSRHPQ